MFSKQKQLDLAFLAVAFLATAVLFWPARHAGFVSDWLGWEYRYRAGSWADALHCFGYRGLLHVGQAIFFGMWQLFERSGPAWLAVGAAIHAANGWLGWRLFAKILEKTGAFSASKSRWLALPGAALFLFSPYVAEPIVWRVCLHYLASTAMVLGAIWAAIFWLENGSRRWLFAAHGLGLAAIFTLEISLVYPVLLAFFAIFWLFSIEKSPKTKARSAWLVGLGALAWPIFFGLNKLMLGQWVGHYGAETHFKMSLEKLSATALKYLSKHAAFARYFDGPTKEKVFAACSRPEVLWSTAAVLLGLFLVWLFGLLKTEKGEKKQLFGASGLAFWCFFIALGPALNLFFVELLWSESDRYGYLGSLFLWQAAGLALGFLPKILRWPLVAALLVNSIFLLTLTVDVWRQNDRVFRGLVRDFRWHDAEQVVILGLGENLRGSYLFRLKDGPSGFAEALELYSGRKFQGKMLEIAQFNMETWSDGVDVRRDSTGRELCLVFRQYGNWWWPGGVHEFNKKDAFWQFRRDEWGSAIIRFPEKLPENTVFIVQNGDRWEEIKL